MRNKTHSNQDARYKMDSMNAHYEEDWVHSNNKKDSTQDARYKKGSAYVQCKKDPTEDVPNYKKDSTQGAHYKD